MKPKRTISKKDFVVALFCIVFLLAGLGAVGATGRRRAMEAACRSTLIKWGVASRLYADDHAGYFWGRAMFVRWVDTFRPYYRNSRMLFCPQATKTYDQGARNPYMAWKGYGGIGSDALEWGSYAINLWVSNNPGTDDYWGTPYVARAAEVPFLVDGQWRDLEPSPIDEPSPHEQDLWTAHENEMQRACINRHMGVNVVFLDGSVRKVGLKHLWRLKWHRNWPADAPLPAWPAWMQNFKKP